MLNTDMESPPPQPAPTTVTLKQLEGKDSGLLRMLKAEVESLKEISKRTQVKGLKESVDQVLNIIGSIEQNNIEMRAVRSQVAGNKLMVVDAKKVATIFAHNLSTVVKDSAEVKAAVANIQTTLEAQSVKMHKMAERGKHTGWTEVVKSKKKDRGDKPATKPVEQVSSQRRGIRPPAILVDVSKEDFPEFAKKIRGGASRDVIGNRIVGMRQT